ncbi:MAG: ornithine cyclodeaminase family protein [Thermoplasmata archaeon]|nr:ornithine cyclodeaminase family protein [Candidatus Sysuiplasma jiujiangense]MBX8639141.1 ornithine cyclodeaminase family protein [Candidatus Sysuiplasma jiujiangense]MBX8641474.1 ornithine cyclodeaminase family protein [Candidatus Sysuiplasma jiujiangense]
MAVFLRESDVDRLVGIREAIDILRDSFRMESEGRARILPRSRIRSVDGTLNVMASTIDDLSVSGLKAYFGGRGGVSFVVILFSTKECRTLAVIEAGRLGQIRTGAMSGLVTDIMAVRDAHLLGCIGTGYQAETQVEAVAAVRDINKIIVWSRTAENRRKFADRMREKLGIDTIHAESVSELKRCDVLITATSSRTPVISASDVPDTCHINAIGANRMESKELETETVCSAGRIVVDSIEQAKQEARDIVDAVSSSCLDWRDITEVHELVSGHAKKIKGRENGITIFKSLGIALEDVAIGKYVYDSAIKTGIGTELQ